MTKIAFFADLHADDYGSKVDPETGLNARFLDSLDIARFIAEDAHRRGCEALVFGGDMTEARHPAPWRVALIGEALDEFGGPIIVARGNHDGLRGGRSIADDMGARVNWRGFSRPGVALVGDTAVAVLPYMDKHHLRALPGMEAVPEADVFRALGEQFLSIARGLFVEASGWAQHTVLVVHQGLSGGQMTEAQQAFLGDHSLVVDTGALAAIGFDAVLAGHFHMHQVLRTDPLVVYAGAPHRVTFQEALQNKGYLVIDTDRLPAFEFVETPARRFVTLSGACRYSLADTVDAVVRCVDVDPAIDPAALRQALERDGAFEVASITHRPAQAATPSGGLAEALTAEEALQAYFADDDDAQALVERGREILQAAA